PERKGTGLTFDAVSPQPDQRERSSADVARGGVGPARALVAVLEVSVIDRPVRLRRGRMHDDLARGENWALVLRGGAVHEDLDASAHQRLAGHEVGAHVLGVAAPIAPAR